MAHVIYRVGPERVERVLQRMPRAKGAARFTAILRGDTKTLIGYLEKGFFGILRGEKLPLPEANRYTTEGFLNHMVERGGGSHQATSERPTPERIVFRLPLRLRSG